MEDMETKYAMELLFMTMEDPLSQPKEQYVSSVDIVINPLLVQWRWNQIKLGNGYCLEAQRHVHPTKNSCTFFTSTPFVMV